MRRVGGARADVDVRAPPSRSSPAKASAASRLNQPRYVKLPTIGKLHDLEWNAERLGRAHDPDERVPIDADVLRVVRASAVSPWRSPKRLMSATSESSRRMRGPTRLPADELVDVARALDEIVLPDRRLSDVRERRARALRQEERARATRPSARRSRCDGALQSHNLTGTIVIPTNEL